MRGSMQFSDKCKLPTVPKGEVRAGRNTGPGVGSVRVSIPHEHRGLGTLHACGASLCGMATPTVSPLPA